jgi:hypothetical protein
LESREIASFNYGMDESGILPRSERGNPGGKPQGPGITHQRKGKTRLVCPSQFPGRRAQALPPPRAAFASPFSSVARSAAESIPGTGTGHIQGHIGPVQSGRSAFECAPTGHFLGFTQAMRVAGRWSTRPMRAAGKSLRFILPAVDSREATKTTPACAPSQPAP